METSPGTSTHRSMDTSVVIVGAGPTGLSLACQLARHGVDFVIVDKGKGVTPFSKAIGVQARTLEIYEQLGIAASAVEEGAIADRARVMVGGVKRGELELSTIGRHMSPYPFVLMLEQSKNERLLYECLQRGGHDVEWNTTFESCVDDDEGVSVMVRGEDGTARTIRTRYLVGCDGPKSVVRHAMGVGFSGTTLDRMFYVADTRVTWSIPHDGLTGFLAQDAFILFFPLEGHNRYRIVGMFPEGYEGESGEAGFATVAERVKEQTEVPIELHDLEWFSTYKVHTRHALRFGVGRCFIAGDAAHIHSPAGAQGMNTGIQDAYNLGWKLALVLRDHASPALLDSYNEERLANAMRLIKTSDRMFNSVASGQPLLSYIRLKVMPHIARRLMNNRQIQRLVFPVISQIGIHVRRSSLSNHEGDRSLRVKAGDRMPYLVIDGRSIYDDLHAPAFHLITFSDDHSYVPTSSPVVRAGANTGGVEITTHRYPLTLAVRKAFGVEGAFTVLLRPDNYLAQIAPGTEANELLKYFRRPLFNN